MNTHPAVSVQGLGKTYGSGDAGVQALADVSFTVAPGEFVSVVGPSGAGKTTLLQCLSGLLSPTTGEVSIYGEKVRGPMESLGLVFQDYSRSLFPWLTARGNVALPLRSRGFAKSEVLERTRSSLAAVDLSGHHDKYPWQMSGGMQQRVAIARALALRPRVLLMDEPFASVDAQTRFDLEDLVLTVWSQMDVTVLFVTHDIDEAVYLSHRVEVLSLPPTVVASEMDVPLARPRHQVTTREDPEFGHLRAELLRRVMRLRAEGEARSAQAT